jgi:hypothetical protein
MLLLPPVGAPTLTPSLTKAARILRTSEKTPLLWGGGRTKLSLKMPKAKRAKVRLTAEQQQEAREAFNLYDADGSGEIDEHELLLAFKSLGFDTKPAAVKKMVSLYDHDGNGAFAWACARLAAPPRHAAPHRASSRRCAPAPLPSRSEMPRSRTNRTRNPGVCPPLAFRPRQECWISTSSATLSAQS